MRRRDYLLGACIALLLYAVPGFGAEPQESRKVFMYVTDGARDLDLMLDEEIGVMKEMLERAGFVVDIATSRGQELVGEDATLTPTVSLADVEIGEYAGVILPCMAPAPGTPPPPASVNDILERALALDIPIAASRGSVATLARAGGIAGRNYAYASKVDIEERPEFTGGTYLGIGVVRHGNISTAGICPLAARSLNEPDGTVELTRNFIESMGES